MQDLFLSPWIRIRRIWIRIQKAPESGSETLIISVKPRNYVLIVSRTDFRQGKHTKFNSKYSHLLTKFTSKVDVIHLHTTDRKFYPFAVSTEILLAIYMKNINISIS